MYIYDVSDLIATIITITVFIVLIICIVLSRNLKKLMNKSIALDVDLEGIRDDLMNVRETADSLSRSLRFENVKEDFEIFKSEISDKMDSLQKTLEDITQSMRNFSIDMSNQVKNVKQNICEMIQKFMDNLKEFPQSITKDIMKDLSFEISNQINNQINSLHEAMLKETKQQQSEMDILKKNISEQLDKISQSIMRDFKEKINDFLNKVGELERRIQEMENRVNDRLNRIMDNTYDILKTNENLLDDFRENARSVERKIDEFRKEEKSVLKRLFPVYSDLKAVLSFIDEDKGDEKNVMILKSLFKKNPGDVELFKRYERALFSRLDNAIKNKNFSESRRYSEEIRNAVTMFYEYADVDDFGMAKETYNKLVEKEKKEVEDIIDEMKHSIDRLEKEHEQTKIEDIRKKFLELALIGRWIIDQNNIKDKEEEFNKLTETFQAKLEQKLLENKRKIFEKLKRSWQASKKVKNKDIIDTLEKEGFFEINFQNLTYEMQVLYNYVYSGIFERLDEGTKFEFTKAIMERQVNLEGGKKL